jgi:hypothetical protein
VELAPAFLPPRLDWLGGDVGELAPEPVFAGRVGVDGERAAGFLEALRMELEQLGRDLLERLGRSRDDDPPELARAQRNALFSFSKNPSSLR